MQMFSLVISICNILDNKCSLCNAEVNGYRYSDLDGHEIYNKRNNELVYLCFLEMGFSGNNIIGFHLGFVNIRNRSLIVKPVVCNIFFWKCHRLY